MAVLRDQGKPITVSEIAHEIRRRGNYHPPRSARPVSGAVVSRRVSNPNYRTLFQRSGGRVGLAPK